MYFVSMCEWIQCDIASDCVKKEPYVPWYVLISANKFYFIQSEIETS